MKKLMMLLTVVGLLAQSAIAADVQLIANPSVGAVEPVLGGTAPDAFLKAYVGKRDQGLKNHFKSMVFTGKGAMPKSFATDAEVVKYVTATKGAIGYVSAAADTGAAKKIAVK